jgi:hypothetical protein
MAKMFDEISLKEEIKNSNKSHELIESETSLIAKMLFCPKLDWLKKLNINEQCKIEKVMLLILY